MRAQLLLTLALCVCSANAQSMQWINNCNREVQGGWQENQPIGTVVCTASATYRNSTADVTYSVTGTEFLTANATSGEISIIKIIDRERNPRIEFRLLASYTRVFPPAEIPVTRAVIILDVNDVAPMFEGLPYAAEVNEAAPNGTVFYDRILVVDNDASEVNGEITLECYPPTATECSLFSLILNRVSSGRFNASMKLNGQVDFERKTFYIMTLLAKNVASPQLNQTVQLVITIRDNQDTDPSFRVDNMLFPLVENSTIVTAVGTVEARDGDGGDNLGRPVVIEIANDPLNVFEMAPTQNPIRGSVFYRAELMVRAGQKLDREASYGGFYRLNVSVTELYSTNRTKTSVRKEATVTILVSDINDNRPMFVNGSVYNISVIENLADRSVVPGLDILVKDADVTSANNRMKISILSATFADAFDINPTDVVGEGSCNLLVRNSSRLNYEQPAYRFHTLELLLREIGTTEAYSATATVYIRVTDVNDHVPQFIGNATIYEYEVSEARPIGWIVTDSIRAIDRDTGLFGQITYSLSGTDADKLAINSSSGLLTLAKSLDYEVQKELIATITATDGGGLSSAAVLYVRVTNFNDKAPFFSLDRYTATIREQSTVMIPPLILRTNDSDSTAPIRFTIISGNTPDNAFRVVNQNASKLNGELVITRPGGFNYSDTPSSTFGRFVLRVLAEDDGIPPLNSTATVEISLQDINNNAPVFNPKNYSASIAETAIQGQVLVTVRATDDDIDLGTNKRISYYLQAGSVDKFAINSLTGEITVARTNSFDINVEGSAYFLQVVARDGGAPILSDVASVYVTVTDSNNKMPVFEQTLYIFRIDEDAAIGYNVGAVRASDLDSNSNLVYSFAASSVSARNTFSLQVTSRAEFDYVTALSLSTNGSLVTQSAMNRDIVAEIQFIATVRDTNAESPSVQTATATVVVQIIQKSIRKPVFSPPWTASNPQILVPLPEGLPAGTTVISLSATDPSTRERVTNFRIIPGSNSESVFSLDSNTGTVAITKVLDFENRLSTRLSVIVEATSPSNATALCTVIVAIQDRNDNAPIFLSTSYTFTVSEDARYPQEFGMVVARDADSGDFGAIRYSLLGTGSSLFELDPTLGTLKPASGVTLDREAESQFNFLTKVAKCAPCLFQVRATDSPSATSAAAQRYTDVPLTITLTDSNDNAPTYTNPSFTVSIFENIPVRSVITTLTATDPDAGLNGRVSFSINAGNSLGYFGLDPNTGALRVLTSLIGKTDASPYSLTVAASDSGSPMRSNVTTLTVVVRSVSETRGNPVVTYPIEDGTYDTPEEAAIGSSILQATARDPDSSGSGLVFSLSGQDVSKFAINSTTGWITNMQRLDRETQQTFLLVVSVRDAAGLDTLRPVKFTLRLADVNDNAPRFPGCNGQYNTQPALVTVKENTANRDISTFTACDADSAPNNVINYFITCGNTDNRFSIGQTTGVLRIIQSADREVTSEYLICLLANNTQPLVAGVETNNSALQVKVIIQDEDDNGPSFAAASRAVYIRSDVEFNSEVATLAATDQDLSVNWNHVYQIRSVQFTSRDGSQSNIEKTDAFSISSATGAVRTRYVDYQSYSGGSFEVNVRVRDSKSREASTKLVVTILGDENLLRYVVSQRPIDAQSTATALLNNATSASGLSLTFQKVTHHVTTASTSDQSLADVCFVARSADSKILTLIDAEAQLARGRSATLDAVYSNFNVLSIGYCSTYSLFKTYDYLGIEAFWWLFIAMSGLIIAFAIGLSAFVVLLYKRYEHMCVALQYQQ